MIKTISKLPQDDYAAPVCRRLAKRNPFNAPFCFTEVNLFALEIPRGSDYTSPRSEPARMKYAPRPLKIKGRIQDSGESVKYLPQIKASPNIISLKAFAFLSASGCAPFFSFAGRGLTNLSAYVSALVFSSSAISRAETEMFRSKSSL